MSAPNYPLRLDPLRRAGWKRAAELEGRTLAGWIKSTCDNRVKETTVTAMTSFQSAAELPDNDPDDIEPICGETFEHDIDHEEYCEEDGRTYWHCRRCDAEGFNIDEESHS